MGYSIAYKDRVYDSACEMTRATHFKTKIMNKLFIVRKYIFAKNAMEAISLDKKTEVDDCFIDNDWKLENIDKAKVTGFTLDKS